MILTEEDVKFIDFAYSCINKAHYPSSKETVDCYNRCFADKPTFRKKGYTNCGSCIRNMVLELKREKDKIITKIEKKEEKKNG